MPSLKTARFKQIKQNSEVTYTCVSRVANVLEIRCYNMRRRFCLKQSKKIEREKKVFRPKTWAPVESSRINAVFVLSYSQL